jgi:hypothetical protein
MPFWTAHRIWDVKRLDLWSEADVLGFNDLFEIQGFSVSLSSSAMSRTRINETMSGNTRNHRFIHGSTPEGLARCRDLLVRR